MARPGRPPDIETRTERLLIALTSDEKAQVGGVAERLDMSMARAIRTGIDLLDSTTQESKDDG